jgi:hypothetical protein
MLDGLTNLLKGRRREIVLKELEVVRCLDPDEVGPGRQRLAELDRCRA